MNINRKLAINSKWILLGILFVVIISMFFVVNNNEFIGKILHYFGVYTEEINIVQISSDGYKNNVPGSWNVTKSAEWTSSKTAKITFEIDSIAKTEHYKDVVLVLDNSNSMEGQKIDVLKNNTIGLISELLNDSNNRVALITFNSDSTIVSEFSTDKDTLISFVENIDVAGNTDYYKALKNVEYVLDGYQESEDTDLVVLFLTDGYPNISNQVAQYKLLKEKYPYITINGVQYEMGTSTIISQIKSVTDNQFIAERNTLNNVLFKAVYMPKKYIDFELTDYIDSDNFYVDGIDSISATVGNVEFDKNTQKVVWNLDNVLYSGDEDVTLTINVNLLNKFVSVKGYYETNKNVTVDYHLEDGESDTIESNNTPVLKNYRTITFDTNMPDGCSGSIETEEKFIFSKVSDPSYAPVCNGYSFKGWEVEEPDVIEINEDMFIVPTHDVTVRAVWTKNDIVKTMSGVVSEKTTLWIELNNRGIEKDGFSLYKGDGAAQFEYPVYYSTNRAEANVIFAGYCWTIARTTETGGVKMRFNGVPSASGSCNNSEIKVSVGNSAFNSNASFSGVGYMYNTIYTRSTKGMNRYKDLVSRQYMLYYNYYFSDSYTYENGKYVLTNANTYNWADNYNSLKGYYYCAYSNSQECSKLNYVVATDSSYSYYITLTDGEDLSSANEEVFFSKDYVINDDGSFSLVDYSSINLVDWYNESDNYKGFYTCFSGILCNNLYYVKANVMETTYYYDLTNSVVYGNDVKYENGKYVLVNTISERNWAKADIDNYHYTCFSESDNCESVYYIYYAGATAYHITLSNGENIQEAINLMLYSTDSDTYVNKYDSDIKKVLDSWYENNLILYSEFLEDTVWCNDRTISNYAGWNPNGGDASDYLRFKGHTATGYFTCNNLTDKFTVSEENGNGDLKYPIGLLTYSEARIGSVVPYEYHWLLTPSDYYNNEIKNTYIYTGTMDGKKYIGLGDEQVTYSNGVIPAISLIPDIEYLDGDGSYDYPYIIDIGQGDESNEN